MLAFCHATTSFPSFLSPTPCPSKLLFYSLWSLNHRRLIHPPSSVSQPPAYVDEPAKAAPSPPHKSYAATDDATPAAPSSSSNAPLLAGAAIGAQAGMMPRQAGFGSEVEEDDWKYGTSVSTSDVTIR
jgi:hypothetical protein